MEKQLQWAACLFYQSKKIGIQEFKWISRKVEQGVEITSISRQKDVPLKLKDHFDKNVQAIELAREELVRVSQSKIRKSLIYWGHEDYPKSFYNMPHPPVVLTFCGTPVWKESSLKGLAVVGSREPTVLSYEWIECVLTPVLKQRRLWTVSGAARGIDQKVHAASLLSGVPTVAILPSGLESIYPQNFTDWVDSILQSGGAILSEFPLEQRMKKHYFCQRNRLIAGLAGYTLLIEAKRKSGSLMTAHYAIDQNRELAVVPGHPLQGQFCGGLDLISQGACLVSDSASLTSWLDINEARGSNMP